VLVTGGLNKGKLALQLMQLCPTIQLFGVEIQESAWKEATALLRPYPSAKTFHQGWGNETTRMKWHGSEEGAGFYIANSVMPDTQESGQEVPVTTLLEFLADNAIIKVDYLLVDAEGYETPIIQGMQLHVEEHRKKFGVFQYELGGTWERADPRHPKGSWSQFVTAIYLESLGYELYLIGCDNYLRVSSMVFAMTHDEVLGGNCLAVHPAFANANILENVRKSAITFE